MRYPHIFSKLSVGLAVCAATFLMPGHAAPVNGQGTWETTLQGRDLDGNTGNGFEAFYDTALNITWLADANFAQTSGFDDDGYMNWDTAMSWAASLNVNGITGWRLPDLVDVGLPGCDGDSNFSGPNCSYNVSTSTSELAHMYHLTLDNKAYYDTSGNGPQSGWGLTNTGPFKNIQSSFYWTGVEYDSPQTEAAWFFGTYDGLQGGDGKIYELNAWAVHDGDIAPVPEPTTCALTLAGLTALLAVRRRSHR